MQFRTRSAAVLGRMGYFDDPCLFDTLTDTELPHLQADMAAVAGEPWSKHISRRDPRFAEFLPKVDATVYDIATGCTPEDQRFLWDHLDGLRAAIDAQAARTLGDAVAEYVAAISGQYGDRLEALLARTGLGGQDPLTGVEMARRLGVSDQRASQIVQRLWYHRDGADRRKGRGCRR